MGWKTTRITREELFDKAWSQPISKLAKEFGISDVGLAKICKKLNIPRPPQGYWQRKYRRNPPTLPPTKGPTEHVFRKWIEPELELDHEEKTERELLLDQEKKPEKLVQVMEESEGLHRLALRTQKQLLKAVAKKSISELSWISGGVRCLDISVSPALINRAIQVMNALVKGLEERKYRVTIENGRTCINVLGEKFWLTLEEPSKRIDHIPTEKEIREMKKHSWLRPDKYDYIPSGRLSLKIDKDTYGYRRSWNDGKKRRIENCLNDVIVGLIDAAFKEKSRRAENERRERERKEYERLKQEKQKEIKKEKEQIEQLETNAENWYKSQKLRKFIEAVRQSPNINENEPKEDIDRWLEWATQQADRLDPLVESPPSILDEENKWCGYYGW